MGRVAEATKQRLHCCFAAVLCSTSAISWQRNITFPKLHNN